MKAKGKHTTITYTYLYKSAVQSYEKGISSEEGDFYYNLNSIVMSAFSFEAFLNHCGKYFFEEGLIDDWDEFKWEKTLEKFDIITTLAKVEIDKSTFPYQSIPELMRLRNALAHGETETIHSELEVEKYDEIRNKLNRPEWEIKCNSEIAKRFIDDVRAIIVLIHKNIYDNDDPFIIMFNGFFGES